ncbi:MAG: hypothetical protein ACRECD_14385 [Burkholderiaceae bacterium]
MRILRCTARLTALLGLPCWLAACATQAPPAAISATLPPHWQAPLPSAPTGLLALYRAAGWGPAPSGSGGNPGTVTQAP